MTYDRQIAKVDDAGLGALRRELLDAASGRVLEIGSGTGTNIAFYGPSVESLTMTEPETPMLRRLERKASEQVPQASVVRAPAEQLPFDDGSFDTVVSTLVLCGVDDQLRALAELRRVLRPGGQLLFLEHVRAEDVGLARTQDRMNGLNRFLVGCECNRTTRTSIEASGFEITKLDETTMQRVPKFVAPLIVGAARASAV